MKSIPAKNILNIKLFTFKITEKLSKVRKLMLQLADCRNCC